MWQKFKLDFDMQQADNQKLAKNTVFLYIRMIVVMFVTFFTTRILLSTLGVEDFGIYNVVCGFVTMFSFLNTSMANGVQRFYSFAIGKNDTKSISKIFTLAVIIQLIIAVIIIVIVETVGIWYLYNKMNISANRVFAAFWVLQNALLSLFFVILTVPYNGAVMAYEKMNFYAIVSIIDAILKMVVVFILPYCSIDKLIFYGLMISVISILDFLFNFIYCKRNFLEIKFVRDVDRDLLPSMISFSGWNVFGSLAHMGKIQGVNLVLNAFWGTVINTAFGISAQISNAVSSLTAGFVTALRPQMIKSFAAGDIGYTMRLLYSASKLTFFLILIIAVPIFEEISSILDFWLGVGKYPNMTIVFCKLTILTVLFDSLATPLSIIVHASGKMRTFQIVCSFVVISVVPLSYVVAKIWNDTAIVISVGLFTTILAQIVRLFLVKKIVEFSIKSYSVKVFVPTIIVFLISCIVALLVNRLSLDNLDFWGVLMKIGLNIIVCFVVIYMIGLSKTEKNLIKSFIKKY